ncbi:carbohydrate ABC transporter permease [Kushneria aurantia]|uniref:Carbohydrate ABC transporter permease n=1 Tax=Kushneria aurantia TaxID=504092 RepID=A0ABV6FYZ2_9GAMM|nr:carbohydrate ABC transporter permease [Kushneria aurantia]
MRILRTRASRRRMRHLLTYAGLLVASVYALFPLAWALATALKPSGEILSDTPTFFTAHPTLAHFREVLFETAFPTYFVNSVIVSLATVVVSLAVGIFAAYAISRLDRTPGIRAIGVAMLVGQMVPVVLLIMPLYQFMQATGLLNTYIALIMTYTVFAIPIITWMMKGFFDTVPIEIEEAARLDGCSRLYIVLRIILPLSTPAIMAAAIYALILAWSEFVLAFTLISDDSMRTLSTGVFSFMGLWTVNWGSLMSAAVLIVLPVAVVFGFTQKYLVSGLTAGSGR